MFGAIVGSMIAARASRKNQQAATGANVDAMKHRHQWEVDDLKAAGLNPILSAGGSGTGGMPSAMGAPVPDYGANITNALQTGSNIEKQDAEIGNILANTDLTREQIKAVSPQISKIKQETDLAFQKTQYQSYENANEYDRTMFLQDNPAILKTGSLLREVGLSGDQLVRTVGDIFRVPLDIIKNVLTAKSHKPTPKLKHKSTRSSKGRKEEIYTYE